LFFCSALSISFHLLVIPRFFLVPNILFLDRVGNMAGVHTPVVPIKHQYVLIGPIPEVIEYQKQHGHQLPVLRDLAGSYYIRQERDGLLVGPYENEKVMEICEDWARYLPS